MSIFNVRETERRVIVEFTSAKMVDDQTVDELEWHVAGVCDRAASLHKHLVFDFQAVEFVTSAIIGKLVVFNKRMRRHDADVWLCNLSPNVMQLFRITKLDKVFRFGDPGDGNDGRDSTGCPVPLPPGP